MDTTKTYKILKSGLHYSVAEHNTADTDPTNYDIVAGCRSIDKLNGKLVKDCSDTELMDAFHAGARPWQYR